MLRTTSSLFLILVLGGIFFSRTTLASDYQKYHSENLTLTAITDRMNSFSSELFPSLDQYPDSKKYLQNGAFQGIVRTFLLEMGGRLILVDGGWGSGPRAGQTVEILRSLGHTPDRITDILLTHLDIDHVSGLTDGGKRVYPNARLWVVQKQYEAWTQGEPRNKESVARARSVLAAYKEAGKMTLYPWGAEVLPKITAIQADGHTPGHTVFRIQTGPRTIYLLGDLLHAGDLQLAHPECSSRYDAQPERAAAIRREILQRCVDEGGIVAGAHFLPIGVARSAGSGFVVDEKAVPAER